MTIKILLLYLFPSVLLAIGSDNALVVKKKRILLENYPEAYNPSIIKTTKGYLCAFRCHPNYSAYPWISYIGIVELDENFEPASAPQLLKTRFKNSKTLSQSEDARLFNYQGRYFLIYNDNLETTNPLWYKDRRDIFIAELFCNEAHYSLSAPRKLTYGAKYNSQLWQKNWIPFEYQDKLLITYTINPHEIIYPNLLDGQCYQYAYAEADIPWSWGSLRGSSAAVLDDDEYLAFFHSGKFTSSESSFGIEMWHYYMGAYTFASKPPFQTLKITPVPIVAEGFYTHSNFFKRVILPGGFVIDGNYIHVAYGKDDCEMWIVTLNKKIFKQFLVPVDVKK